MVPVRVVVADDSDVFRSALCDFLRLVPDVEVTAAAEDGAEALMLVRAVHPDVLLLDLEMPEMDGWEVLQELHETSSPPVVLVISSHSGTAIQQLALERGAYAFVNKGNIEELMDMISELTTDLPSTQLGGLDRPNYTM